MKRRVLAALAALLLAALAACGMAVKEVAVWRAVPSFYLTTGSAVRSEAWTATRCPYDSGAAP